MAKFKEFRRGYQPWEHGGGGGSAMGGGGDLHASALDHDFVSTMGGEGAGGDPWAGLAEALDAMGWGADHMEKAAGAVAAWLKAQGAKGVLEVGSGSGRTTRRLLKEGLKVTAVESSPALLERTRANAKGARTEESDFLELPVGPFDAVVSLRNAFSRLTVEGQEGQFLRAARASLGKGGLLSLAFFNRDALDEEALNKVHPSAPSTYKGKRTILYDQWRGHPDGGDRFVWAPLVMIGDHAIDWVRRSISYKFWRPDDVRRQLKDAGFEVLGAFDAADGVTPANRTSRRVELRARAK